MHIPTPVSDLQVSPPGPVDASTRLSFAAPATGGSTVSVFTNTTATDRLFVITSGRTFTIPRPINAMYSLLQGAAYTWVVTTHGDAKSIDEMASASGFIDAYGFSTVALEPTGPARSAGTFTSSPPMTLQIAR